MSSNKDNLYDTPIEGFVYTNNGLNVRKRPSLKSNILYTLRPNEKVLIEGTNGKFFIISTAYGIAGYCLKEFISIPKAEEIGDEE
jgi:uncharacterized protein YgiM (DUF1202 family)